MYETRKRIIYDLLTRKGSVTIVELARDLGVTDMTVRRDIAAMEKEGSLRRVHGGAVAIEGATMETSFTARRVKSRNQKVAIAKRAAGLLDSANALFIDGSTTCSELARLLPSGSGRQIVTDSLSVLLELNGRPGLELILLGGTLDQDGNTFDGVLAVENAGRIKVDLCFFSANGFDPEGVFNAGMIGSQVKQIMIRNSRRSVLLADSTKWGAGGMFKLCDWAEVDVLVSDSDIAPETAENLRGRHTEVIIAERAE